MTSGIEKVLSLMLRSLSPLLLLVGAIAVSTHSRGSQLTEPARTAHERYETAVALMGAGEYERATEALREIILDYPDFQRAYRSLERAHVMLGDDEGAAAFFSERVTATPDNALAHYWLGVFLDSEDRAIEQMKRAIALDPLFGRAYRDLAQFAIEKGDPELAIAFFQERLEESEVGARAYYGLGWIYDEQGQPAAALGPLQRAVGLDGRFTLARSELISVYGAAGRYRDVLSESERLLEIAEQEEELEHVAYAHLTLGIGHSYLGNYWVALDHLTRSLELTRQAGERGREAIALTAIANTYLTLGESEKAMEYHRASYELAKQVQDRLVEVTSLNNLGTDLTAAGRSEEALPYLEQGLQLAREEGFRHDEAFLLLNMAAAHDELGDRDRAVQEYSDALELARELGSTASEGPALGDLGHIERKRGRFAEAIQYFDEVMALAETYGDMEFRWEGLVGLGQVFEQRGDAVQAIAHYSEAVELYEQARAVRLGAMGGAFLDYQTNVYPPLIRLLAEAGRVEEAFDVAQAYKATSLLDVVSEGRNLADDLLPERYRVALTELRSSLESTHAALSRARAEPEPDHDEIDRLEREVADLELQRASLVEAIRRDEGAYVDLTSSEPATLQTIRSRILPASGALIDYVVGEETLSAFVVTQDELRYHGLPISAEELTEMLKALSPVLDEDKETDESSRATVFGPQLADFSIPPARALHEALVEPLEPGLAHSRELVIVPDGLLHYLPFETLVTDATEAANPYDFGNATFLLERYAISYAASASLLDPNLQRPRSADRGLLAFGNPDFTRDESERLPEAFYASTLMYSGGVVRGDELLPLPASESEVAAIERSLRAGSRVYVGREATETAFREEASHYSVLHFATHFLNDDRQPLYSKIVLSRGDDPVQDGYLQTYEIFNTRLNADLVVLSACSTGLGKLSQGEGLAGISRAFLYAGVPSLVVSLWSVEDEATAAIMERFYGHLKDGANKNAALRQAKIDYLRSARGEKKDPFYWAPFVLIGDSQPVSLPDTPVPYWIVVMVALVLLLVSRVRRRARPRPRDPEATDVKA